MRSDYSWRMAAALAVAAILWGAAINSCAAAENVASLVRQLMQFEKSSKRADVEAMAQKIMRAADTDLAGNPAVFADVAGIVAGTYRRVGKLQEALTLYRREL